MSNNEHPIPSSGDYSTLCNYNNGSDVVQNMRNARPVVGMQVVPQWNAIGYNALQHGKNVNGGYPNIMAAYGEGADRCDQAYLSRMCNKCSQ